MATPGRWKVPNYTDQLVCCKPSNDKCRAQTVENSADSTYLTVRMASTPDIPRTRDPEKTRERILDAAQALILDHGYGSTTVDAVVTRAGITKGALFHHFGSKGDLARSLVDRYALLDKTHLEAQMERAAKLATDPLQQVLVLIALYEEDFEQLAEPFPGCLFASYIYENKLFDAETIGVLR